VITFLYSISDIDIYSGIKGREFYNKIKRTYKDPMGNTVSCDPCTKRDKNYVENTRVKK
jgi:hypothetical protein